MQAQSIDAPQMDPVSRSNGFVMERLIAQMQGMRITVHTSLQVSPPPPVPSLSDQACPIRMSDVWD